jgi:hypothetical protein
MLLAHLLNLATKHIRLVRSILRLIAHVKQRLYLLVEFTPRLSLENMVD